MSNDNLCKCKGVSKSDVKRAIAAGATSFKEVKKATGAGSTCGKCKAEVKRYIKKHTD